MRLMYVFCGALAIAVGVAIFSEETIEKSARTKQPSYSQALIAPFSPEQYPTWYASWGEAALTRINSRLKSVADTAALQSGCSELQFIGISEMKSNPPTEFIFFADCKSGSLHVRYYIDEQLSIVKKRNYNF